LKQRTCRHGGSQRPRAHGISRLASLCFIDEPAITDGKIVTARAPIDLAAFVHAIDDLLVAA
jgi:putative intracellular protease/amidase